MSIWPTSLQQGEITADGNYSEFPNSSKGGRPGGGAQRGFYNLDAIIAVGFRVNSARAIQFRQWATGVLRDYAIRGYVLDKERLKNGAFLSKEYFDNLLAEIREIRASERKFYQKITDIYATAMDYDVGGRDHTDLLCHSAEQAAFRHPRAHRRGIDRGAGGQQEGAAWA